MNNSLQDLARCGDANSLASALHTLCAGFGSLSRLDILTMTDAGKRRAVCLLRLDSPEREQDLMATLGAGRFGEDLCVVLDLGVPDRAQA